MKTAQFLVKDMHCVNCSMRLQMLEDDLLGVVSIDASYSKQKMVVIFDETLLDEQRIIQAVQEMGYTAQLIAG